MFEKKQGSLECLVGHPIRRFGNALQPLPASTTAKTCESLQNTPIGKLQVLQTLMSMGMIPKNPPRLLGVSKGYGWTQDDFTVIQQSMPGMQPDAAVVTGQ